MTATPQPLTPQAIEALEKEKASLLAAMRQREAASVATAVVTAVAAPTDGIASLLSRFSQSGREALNAYAAANHAAVVEALSPLVKRGQAALHQHGQLRDRHQDRVNQIVATFGPVGVNGSQPMYSAMEAALPHDFAFTTYQAEVKGKLIERKSRDQVSPSRMALTTVHQTSYTLSRALSAQLAGNMRDLKRQYDCADLADALTTARTLLNDETSTLDGDALRLKVTLEKFTTEAEQLVGSIEFHVQRLDDASATLQKLLGDATPKALFADPGSGVYRAPAPQPHAVQETSYRDFDPFSHTAPSVAPDPVEVTKIDNGASVRTKVRR